MTVQDNRDHATFQLESLSLEYDVIKAENHDLKYMVQQNLVKMEDMKEQISVLGEKNMFLEEKVKTYYSRIKKIESKSLNYDIELEENKMIISQIKRKLEEKQIEVLDYKRKYLDIQEQLDVFIKKDKVDISDYFDQTFSTKKVVIRGNGDHEKNNKVKNKQILHSEFQIPTLKIKDQFQMSTSAD